MSAGDKRRRDRGGLRTALALAAAVWLALAGAPAGAQQKIYTPFQTDARRYADCMALARTSPKKAHEEALAWRRAGGGDAALHCVAVALLGMGDYVQAAQNLEALARSAPNATPEVRADLLGQAGSAWTIAGKPELAFKAQSTALALKPGDIDLLIDRGITLAGTGNYWEALDDLNRALSLDPDRVDALVFRASAWRALESLDLAEDDTTRALTLSPGRLDALLERGLIRKARGNIKGARADWTRVLELGKEGPSREAARRELEKLDIRKR